MGKSTRVRSPSEEAGSASRDGAATAAADAPRPRRGENVTAPPPLVVPGQTRFLREEGKYRSDATPAAAAVAMRAVSLPLWVKISQSFAMCFCYCHVGSTGQRRSGFKAVSVLDPLGGL
jgi:hypothetical protein